MHVSVIVAQGGVGLNPDYDTQLTCLMCKHANTHSKPS